MNRDTIIDTITNIDIETYNSIEEVRSQILSDEKFQQWCKDMKIGSRVEVKDYRSNELMNQYIDYPEWLNRQF